MSSAYFMLFDHFEVPRCLFPYFYSIQKSNNFYRWMKIKDQIFVFTQETWWEMMYKSELFLGVECPKQLLCLITSQLALNTFVTIWCAQSKCMEELVDLQRAKLLGRIFTRLLWITLFDIQPRNFAYIRLLNKPYENEVTLRGQKPPLNCC